VRTHFSFGHPDKYGLVTSAGLLAGNVGDAAGEMTFGSARRAARGGGGGVLRTPYKKNPSQNPRFCVSRSRVKRPSIPGWRNRNRSHTATRHTKNTGFPGIRVQSKCSTDLQRSHGNPGYSGLRFAHRRPRCLLLGNQWSSRHCQAETKQTRMGTGISYMEKESIAVAIINILIILSRSS